MHSVLYRALHVFYVMQHGHAEFTWILGDATVLLSTKCNLCDATLTCKDYLDTKCMNTEL